MEESEIFLSVPKCLSLYKPVTCKQRKLENYTGNRKGNRYRAG